MGIQNLKYQTRRNNKSSSSLLTYQFYIKSQKTILFSSVISFTLAINNSQQNKGLKMQTISNRIQINTPYLLLAFYEIIDNFKHSYQFYSMDQKNNVVAGVEKIRNIIMEKKEVPAIGGRVVLDWKQAQLSLLERIGQESVIQSLLVLQKECLKSKISCFYSFFLMQKIIKMPQLSSDLAKQTEDIIANKSKYHTIRQYIKMRQHLLGKINQFTGNNIKGMFEDIDDIRFLNFQIIRGVTAWKIKWRVEGESEPVFYEGAVNYLLKIGNDNADMINLAKFKKIKFILPPNPFFLSEDGNLQTMSVNQKQQISQCMEILAKERGIDLKMTVQGSFTASQTIKHRKNNVLTKSQRIDASFVREAKNQMQSFKEDQIKKIYKINQSLSSAKLKANADKEAQNNQIRRLTQEKQIQRLTMYKSQKKFNRKKSKSTERGLKQQTKITINKLAFQSPSQMSQLKEQSKAKAKIREQVQKQVMLRKGSQIERKVSPPRKLQVRETKPKIKLIEQKNTIVEQTVKGVFNMMASTFMSNPRPFSRTNSTFYKQVEPIQEEADQNNKTEAKTILKAIQSKPKPQSSTKINLGPYLKKQPKQQKQKPIQKIQASRQLQKERAESSHIAVSKKQIESRSLSSQLKNLTIINIYKSKQGKNRDSRRDKSSSVIKMEQPISNQQQNAMSFITEIPREQPNIDSSKLTVAYERIKSKNEIELQKLQKQLESKSHRRNQSQMQLQQKQKKRIQDQRQLEQKNKIINQLEDTIKVMEGRKKEQHKIKNQVLNQHQRQFQRQKKKREIQSKIIRDNIQKEEELLIRNKQYQLKLKEEQIIREFKLNIKQLEAQSLTKKKQYEEMLILEEKKQWKTKQLLDKEKQMGRNIERQLNQKKMKEKILKKMVEQKQKNINEGELKEEENMEKQLEKELEQRQLMERQALQLMEKDRKRIQIIYEELQQKNRKIQNQNQLKIKILERIGQQREQEVKKFKQIEEHMRQSAAEVEKTEKTEKTEENNKTEDDLESMKSKIKKELLEQLMKNKQREEQEAAEEEQRRYQRLKRIEEQVAKTLKEEEDQMQRQNQQFLKRIQAMKEKHQIVISQQKEEKMKKIIEEQQQAEKLKQDQSVLIALDKKQEQLINKKQISQSQIVGQPKQNSKSKSKSKQRSIQKHSQQIKQKSISKPGLSFQASGVSEKKQLAKSDSHENQIHQENNLNNSELTESVSTPITHQQLQPEQPNKLANNQLQTEKEGSEIITPKNSKQEKQQQQKNDDKQIDSPIKKIIKQQQNKVQPVQNQRIDLLQKYKNLSHHTHKTKQIFINQSNVSKFIQNFQNHLQRYSKQMLPWTKQQLQKTMLTKKVDIFECNSMGWLDDNGKYILIGSIQCIENIGRKYGAVQIHQIFIFDRNSPYQKQLLAKKIKMFQNLGFVYQKKIGQTNNYSIRLVVKLPIQIMGEPKIYKIELKSRLCIEDHSQNQNEHKMTSAFSYLFSRCLRANLSKQQLQKYVASQQHFDRAVQKQLLQGHVLNTLKSIKIQQMSPKIIDMSITLPLRYFRNQQKAFYLVRCEQYLFVDSFSYLYQLEDGISIILYQQRYSTLPLDFSLMDAIQKIKSGQKMKEIQVCLPVWVYQTKALLSDSHLTYTHRQQMKAELNLSSVCSSFLQKGDFKQLKTPFVMAICENDSKARPIRSISGRLITQKDIIMQNLK